MFNNIQSTKKITSKPYKEDDLKDNYADYDYVDKIRRLSKREKIVNIINLVCN
jgi:hypothetical protein